MLPAIWNVEMRHCLICLPISGSSATREKNVLRAPLARLAIDGAGNRVGDPPVLRQVPGVAVGRAGFLQAAGLTARADLVNSEPIFVIQLEQLEMFAFGAPVLVLLLEVFKSQHGKIACTLVVLLRNKFHDPCPGQH
jgi:hypothetical protein